MLARPEWNERPERDARSIPLSLEWLDELSFNKLLAIGVSFSITGHVLLGYLLSFAE